MHVGVVLGDINPQTGGGFAFVHDVVAAFLDHAHTSSHRFTLFAPQPYVDAMRREKLASNVSIVASYKVGFLDRRISRLRHYLPVFGYFWKSASKSERQMASLGVDLVWLAGGLHDTYEIPYVTTVWDVQHITHPWFPEVSADWRWDHRELFLLRHLRRATSIIVGTCVGKDQIVRYYGVPEEHIAILPHPTPGFALRAAKETHAPLSSVPKDYLLYPAQFWPHKNHVNLLKALKYLTESGRDTPTLVLVGSDQGNRAFVERCAADLAVSHKVLILGFVRTEDLVALYKYARALVYPSFSGPENLPPLEAFALGCPAVVSNYRGAEEQLGDAAILFDPANPAAIAEAVTRVLTDESLRGQLVERGKVRAARWTGREFVNGLFKILDAFEAQRSCWK
jgi:glycosyltransferase involved in cell wall biosynthesis